MRSTRYRRVRDMYMAAHPLCEFCIQKGTVRAATEVHHIVEVESAKSDEESWNLATSITNLKSVCRECHHRIHREMASHTKAAHIERQSESIERWKQRNGRKTGGDFSFPTPVESKTL